jgi:hypothetical protein
MNYVVELTKKELQLLIRGLREVSQKEADAGIYCLSCVDLEVKLNQVSRKEYDN